MVGGLPVAALAVAAGAHPQVLKEVHLQVLGRPSFPKSHPRRRNTLGSLGWGTQMAGASLSGSKAVEARGTLLKAPAAAMAPQAVWGAVP